MDIPDIELPAHYMLSFCSHHRFTQAIHPLHHWKFIWQASCFFLHSIMQDLEL